MLDEVRCTKCQDTGWLVHGTDDEGVPRGAERCSCVEEGAAKRHNEKLLPEAKIPAKYERCDGWDSFIFPPPPDTSRDTLQRIAGVMKAYVRDFSPKMEDPRGLLIWGANGVGKTHLAVVALRQLIQQGYEGRFINYQALLRLIKAGYDQPFGGGRTEAYDEIAQAEVLLLDDMGSNRVTDWVQDTITDLISERYDNKRATIVTTNYAPVPEKAGFFPPLVDRIGERAASRLREMCRPLAMPGLEDYRAKKSAAF